MIKKLLATFGIGPAASAPASSTAGPYRPYAQPHVNFLYNLLFCDDLDLFKNETSAQRNALWSTLLAEQPDSKALQEIAQNASNEGRARAIAFNRLRASGAAVPARQILGVIIEVPQDLGLDVLAAFAGGGVRYLNQSGKVAVFEGPGNPLEAAAGQLLAVSQPLVDRTGPWEKGRLPPPQRGKIRTTFLVSDGLYFGKGPYAALQKDTLGGPVLAKAAQLLQLCVQKALGT